MKQLCLFFCVILLLPVSWQEKVASADTLAEDEAAIATHIKALHDKRSEVRQVAATALRSLVANYPSGTDKDSGKAYWTAKINEIRLGMTKAEVTQILLPYRESPESASMGSGQSHMDIYRLDAHWMVSVTYRNPDSVLQLPQLTQREQIVYVAPPAHYTGTWSNWYVNGQPGQVTQYKEGKYQGTLTVYHDNGQKSYEQHYVNHGAHGADTGGIATARKAMRLSIGMGSKTAYGSIGILMA